ncbi:hypothetical protein DOB02_20290, partial [Salmonella enterica subsp. enterica serovar Uganda]|nr:hypothetical protein [Salmonella enterica subsp. enterica serovar Uganda]EAP6308940.1 hypothetical protein [Salmonella enterica]EBV1331812.1 hypothetical protein [Salmonella enterica subsp. enterica serovar Sinstorf]EBV2813186.1 hypothetical protein [Salmonella enterica subsp. enterica serovar Uganda]EBW9653249.1 hypothetical protein [Salmonella enterica subsp. enterica serovar Uganda]
MNLKRKINCCRKQESYSVSFYFSYKTVAYDPFSEIFRNFSEFLYSGLFGYITIKLNLTFISQ